MVEEKVKVLILLKELGVGGAEKVLINIANNLDYEKFKVTVAFLKDGNYRALLSNGVELIKLESRTPLGIAFEIRRLLRKKLYDVILFSWLKPLFIVYVFNLFKGTRVRTVFRVPISLRSRISKNPLYNNRVFKFFLSRILNRNDKIVVLCEEMKDELITDFGVDERKISVIPNPVDTSLLLKKAAELNPFEHEDMYIHVVSAGRLEYQKGFDVLIKAFKRVSEEFPNAVLTIIGKGRNAKKLQKLAVKLGLSEKVRFQGWVDNPYPYFKNADVFVLSSRFEGFPNVLLEALACGTKVVATDCSTGPREILGENEDYGWLAKTEDSDSLAEKIAEAIVSEKKPSPKSLERFSIEFVTRAYENLIQDTLNPKILFLLSELGCGGAQKVAVVLAKHLAQNGMNVTLLALKDGEYRSYLSQSNVNLILLNVPRARDSLFKVFRVLSTVSPDVVLTTLIQDFFVARITGLLLHKKPKLVLRLSNDVNVLFKTDLHKFFGKIFLSKADRIVTQTYRMEQQLRNFLKVDGQKVTTIFNPVDVDFIKTKSFEFDPFENYKNSVKIVAAGRLVYQKGFDILLRAFKRVLEQIPNANLFLLGDGPCRKLLETMVHDLRIHEAVKFVGWVPNPYPYFRNCDLFVLPSRYEGMPNVLLEALACGAKVVATDCLSGPREILGSNSECGWLVSRVGDHEELAKVIVEALASDPKDTKKCLDKFLVERVIQQYEQVIHELSGW